jgi:two-component system, cell cycle sensor histidine kinase and response regulator CckA
MSAVTEIRWTPKGPERELGPLFENAPIGLAHCGRQGEITPLNAALEQLLDNRPKTARSMMLADLLHPEDAATAQQMLAELFDGKRKNFQIDSTPEGPIVGRVLWTAWRASANRGESEFVLATAEVMNHGTTEPTAESLELEQRLRQAQKLEILGRVAGGVAHDFNNLLTGVLLYCDLLLTSLDPEHRARRYAEEIRNATIHASGLVRQLLAMARPAQGEPRALSLNEIAEGMRNILGRLIGENIALKLQLDSNLGLTRMDPAQAQQILLNLVLNARDAMPAGGQIVVETGHCTIQLLTSPSVACPASLPCVLLAVADNGHGMDAATRAQLFEAFFTTKARKGTGLGMSTVHDIVTASGGLIHVESAPGCGTRVTVLLPLAPDALNASPDRKLSTEPEKNEGESPATETAREN